MNEFISKSENDTLDFAFNFAKSLNKNSIIILSGDLGSGKTKFTEGILKYFGLDNEISSPTFNIVKEYESGEMKLNHMDVYRIEDTDETIAFNDYFKGDGVTIIEWAELIEDKLPDERLEIKFKVIDENTRVLVLKPYGQKYEDLVNYVL